MRFISYTKQNFPYSINSSNTSKLNRLCSLEDWNNDEIIQTFLNCTSRILRQKYIESLGNLQWEY